MGDQHRSPTKDFASIIGFYKTTKSLFTKKNNQKNNKSEPEDEEAKFEAKFDAYKKKQNANNEEESRSSSLRGKRRSVDDNFFTRRSSLLSRNSSRRSHTPSPRPTFLSKTKSKRDEGSSRNASRVGTPESRSPSRSVDSSLQKSTSRRNPIIFSQTATVARRKPPPMEQKLVCTLEDLCFGRQKVILIRKEVISEEGIIREDEELLKIKLKPGWRKGTTITFEGKGDQKPGYLPADIIFLIEEKKHKLFSRRGDDLEIAVEIPLVQALTGCSLSVPLLGGDQMRLSIIEDVIFPGYEKLIKGQGMPKPKEDGKRGDLIVKFLVNFPSYLTDEQRTEAFAILEYSS